MSLAVTTDPHREEKKNNFKIIDEKLSSFSKYFPKQLKLACLFSEIVYKRCRYAQKDKGSRTKAKYFSFFLLSFLF